jgi:hypothetical protein
LALASPRPRHDPGGRTRLALPDGVRGAAQITDCGRYRHSLRRDWTPAGQKPRAILFVGLNPSVADAEMSDPTCHRELTFARDWGFSLYLKGNILDWRATSPRDLPHGTDLARSPRNLEVLTGLALEADVIVMATGNVPDRFAWIEAESRIILSASGRPLMCFGLNKTGFAKHPLYLRKDATLRPLVELSSDRE